MAAGGGPESGVTRLAKEEEERWSRFTAAATTWRTNQVVAQFIAELREAPHNESDMIGDKTVREWLLGLCAKLPNKTHSETG